MRSLTNKQRAFVEHYLGDCMWNATAAARAAGYKGSERTLGGVGYSNLKKEHIAIHIQRRLHELGATTEALMRSWLERKDVDISPYVNTARCKGLDVEALKEAGLGYLIKGVRETRDGTTYILRDPDVAEDRLARALGVFVERRQLSGPDGGPIEVQDVGTPDLSGFTNEELDLLAEIARRLQGDRPAEGTQLLRRMAATGEPHLALGVAPPGLHEEAAGPSDHG